MYTKEGMAYLINAGLGVSVGGAPSPIAQFYIGLSTANRNWSEDDVAATINTVAAEFETYDEATRQAWNPAALATPAALSLSNVGAEGSFTIGDVSAKPGGTITIIGAFIISVSAKNGTSDATAILIQGQNFDTPQVLSSGGVLDVGRILNPVNCP